MSLAPLLVTRWSLETNPKVSWSNGQSQPSKKHYHVVPFLSIGSNSKLLLGMTKVARSRKKLKIVVTDNKNEVQVPSFPIWPSHQSATNRLPRTNDFCLRRVCLGLCVSVSVSVCSALCAVKWRGVLIESDCIDVCSQKSKNGVDRIYRTYNNAISCSRSLEGQKS